MFIPQIGDANKAVAAARLLESKLSDDVGSTDGGVIATEISLILADGASLG